MVAPPLESGGFPDTTAFLLPGTGATGRGALGLFSKSEVGVVPSTPTLKLSTFPANVPPVPTLIPSPYLIFAFGYPATICANEALHDCGAQLNGPDPTFCDENHVPSTGLNAFHACHVLLTIVPPFGTNTNVE